MKEKRRKELQALLDEALVNWEPTRTPQTPEWWEQVRARSAFSFGLRRALLWARDLTENEASELYDMTVTAHRTGRETDGIGGKLPE